MKRTATIITLSTLSIATLIGCGKKQKIIFDVEAVKIYSAESFVQEACSNMHESLDSHIQDGWKIITASPKEKVAHYSRDGVDLRDIGLCIGTEYVLEK